MSIPSKKTTTKSKNPDSQVNQKNNDKSMLMDFLTDELKDIYWAEKHLTKVLPKMEKAATTRQLKQSFMDHLKVTENHVKRLEKAFEVLDKKPQAKKCEAMAGITKEGESIIEDTEKGSLTRDVGLILAAQKVEHYEIATYGSLNQLAKTLGNMQLADIFSATLEEEKEADKTLTDIAENNINLEASQEKEK